MEILVNALMDTPIPAILVISGIFFLILAVADQIAGKVVIDPSRRRSATAIGLSLLVVGVALQFVPRSASPPAAPISAQRSIPAGDKSPVQQTRLPTPLNTTTVGLALNDSVATAKNVDIPSTTREKHKLVGDKRYFKLSTMDKPPEKFVYFSAI